MISTHSNLYQHATCPSYKRCSRPEYSPLRSGGGGGWVRGGRAAAQRTWGEGVSSCDRPKSQWLRPSGRHETTFPFLGRVVEHMLLYGEQGRGRGGKREDQITKNQEIKNFRSRIIRGRRIRPGPPPPNAKYYQKHSQGERPQATGILVGQNRGRPSRHWLEPDGYRRSVKVHCRLQGRQPRHQADSGGRQGKGRSQVNRTRRGEGPRV